MTGKVMACHWQPCSKDSRDCPLGPLPSGEEGSRGMAPPQEPKSSLISGMQSHFATGNPSDTLSCRACHLWVAKHPQNIS